MERRARRPRLPVLRDHGRGHGVGGPGAPRRDPDFPGYDTYLDDRMQARAARLPAPGHPDRHQPGLDQPDGRGRAHRQHCCASWAPRGSGWPRSAAASITDRVARLGRPILEDGPPDRRRSPAASSRPRPTWGRSRSWRRCAEGAHIVVTGRVADPSLFLAPMMFEFGWEPLDDVAARPGQRHRPPDGVRRPGDRRLLRRPGLQGRARAVEPGLPHRRGGGRRHAPCSPRWPAPAVPWTCARSRSSCSTRCTTRPTTSRPTWWSTSPRRGSSRSARTGCG